MTGRILCVDPGEKRLGIAVSDLSQLFATPLVVIGHSNMHTDCVKIINLAEKNKVEVIVIGAALGGDGEETRQARHAQKIAQTLAEMSTLKIIVWDESESTQIARQNAIHEGLNRKKRSGHLDDRAAAVILQDFLDSQTHQENE